MADAADHAWTIAVATGSATLPPNSPPLCHSRGALNVVARRSWGGWRRGVRLGPRAARGGGG